MVLLRYLVPLLLAVWLIVVSVRRAIFRVHEHERLIVFRLGKPTGVRGPGWVMLVPYIQSGVKFDLTDDLDARLIAAYQQQFDKRE